jgi:cyclopropane fatty-acyl-phospholipid synthase-like methyltransferase
MKNKIFKNLVYSNSNIPSLAKYDRIKEGLKNLNIKKIKNILDLGCGPGQALYALKDCNFSGSYMGIDNDSKMINNANQFFAANKYKNFTFKRCNIENFKIEKKFDLILVWGVISFFEDYTRFLDKLKKLLNKKGTISLFSGFTDNEFNVYVQYKYKNGKKQNGLNMPSSVEIINYLKKQNFKVSKKKFIPKVDLKKTKNPLNSYILFDHNKNKVLANGLNIIRNFYFIKAKKL